MREHSYIFDPLEHRAPLLAILGELLAQEPEMGEAGPRYSQAQLHRVLRRHPRDGAGFYSRSQLIAGYRAFGDQFSASLSAAEFAARLRMRPVRTHSGVMPVTVLSKPFPCPGKCVFCPNDVRMPKSYLSDEPGCQRAEQNGFDPYLQTYNRMAALRAIGHRTDKIELIVLGGTWSFYPPDYQRWFIKRCFDAMNDFGAGEDRRSQADVQRFTLLARDARPDRPRAASYNRAVDQHLVRLSGTGRLRSFESASFDQLLDVQRRNELAASRCVGLVLETRPDYINAAEVLNLRRLGCTKVQIGYQSLDDSVLRINKRGHDVRAIRDAMAFLRCAGFKVLAHFMPNLLGATPDSDVHGFARVFDEPDFRPDEMKVYPCSLIETAELMDAYHAGEFRPYDHDELLMVLCAVIARTPRYCRLSRVIRDICSGDIVVGNRHSNFREVAERKLDADGIVRRDIRSREVGAERVRRTELQLLRTRYATRTSEEVFLEYVTATDRIAGFCRLSLPNAEASHFAPQELRGAAIVRELHVYGPAQALGQRALGQAQHQGLGQQLLREAAAIAGAAGYRDLAVISAVGTREYYRRRGFEDGELYQHLALSPPGFNTQS